ASILGSVLRPDTDDLRLIQRLLPHTVGDVWLWLAISLSAGFCEEFLFRGYLLRQFQALTGSLPLALTLQALVYGAVHLVLPYQLAVSVTVLALLLGTLAVWQKSLLPGMIVHAAIDLAGGLLSFAAAPHGSA
ncbi:MAG TPA: CPBP family intramembrane glutamic endopeptidase, partial [Thermoanaerobaculia bacterium]